MTPEQRMTEIAQRFPSMRDVMGAGAGWNVDALIAWLNSGAPTSATRQAAMCLLSIWNPETDWRTQGVRCKAGYGRFLAGHAFAVWDRAHREAFFAWAKEPYYP